jgi:nitrate/nitrite transport system substrate-binding protein
MRRWGQVPTDQTDQWYFDTAAAVYRPDLYETAASTLVTEGVIAASDVPTTDGFKGPQSGFIDDIVYDGRTPNEYLQSLPIGLKTGQTVSAAGVQG